MSGYSQTATAALLVEYREREDRLSDHPGKNGLAGCAVLLDVDYGLERVPESVQDRAREWMDGVEFDRYADPRRPANTTFEPQLVESIPDLQEAIRLAHESEGHLVRWEGRWTSLEALFRMLDDTRTVRRVAGAMSRKTHRVVLTGLGAARGFCSVCGVRRDHGRVWRDLNRDVFWCEEHLESRTG